MATSAIRLEGVTKRFGSLKAIDNVSLEVEAGEIFGFLGPNGAGKSTTINMLVDLIRPTEGKITILGLDSRNDGIAIRQRIGFLNADMALDNGLTGIQQLTYFGNLHGNLPLSRIRELAKILDLNLNRKIKTLSRGNRQKVGLISALMNEPDLLIMDEPTTGLDPLIQAKFNKIILDFKKQGKTVFMSSHLLSEVQEICDRVAFVREGKIISIQRLNEIASASPKKVRVDTSDNKLIASIKKLDGVKLQPTTSKKLVFNFSGDVNQLLILLTKHKIKDLTIQDADLEDAFMHLYPGDDSV